MKTAWIIVITVLIALLVFLMYLTINVLSLIF